jgi:hypothetical protein
MREEKSEGAKMKLFHVLALASSGVLLGIGVRPLRLAQARLLRGWYPHVVQPKFWLPSKAKEDEAPDRQPHSHSSQSVFSMVQHFPKLAIYCPRRGGEWLFIVEHRKCSQEVN